MHQGEDPMTLLLDTRHCFFAHSPDDSVCRVRVWSGTEVSGGVPILVLTELDQNPGQSVTNAIETLVGECVTHYLPEHDGADPPCLVLEHYPNRQASERWWDPMLEETFDTVTLDGWRLEVRAVRDYARHDGARVTAGLPGGWRWIRRYRGEPRWHRISRMEVERLIGEAFPDESAAEGRARFKAARAERLRRLAEEDGRD
jgi:hypothetical protein